VSNPTILLGFTLALLYVCLGWLRDEAKMPRTANFLVCLLLVGVLLAASLALALQALGLWLHELGVVR
jgi:hypothetical protein